jgi:hypothetical protein
LLGAVKYRKPLQVRYTVRVKHYNELQKAVFLDGLVVAVLFKVFQASYGKLRLITDSETYSEPAETSI